MKHGGVTLDIDLGERIQGYLKKEVELRLRKAFDFKNKAKILWRLRVYHKHRVILLREDGKSEFGKDMRITAEENKQNREVNENDVR